MPGPNENCALILDCRPGWLGDAGLFTDRLVGPRNNGGLLSDECDVDNERHVGNAPQLLSPLSLVRATDGIVIPRRAGTNR